jgi:Flp pilus assembly protein TadD
MNRNTLGRIATISLVLGTATVACTPSAHMAGMGGPAPLSAKPAKAEKMAAAEAAKARAALARRKGKEAVASAEKAVGASPRNAEYRMLLGQAYLAAGRFASAETAFRDTLTLSPDQPRAKFDLALAQTAQGRGAEARPILASLDGAVPQADLGLAITLSGDHDAGIAMLVQAARKNDSTARTRQNLALAYALDGRWRESRAVAMQDTPPDRIGDQIAGWAALANPQAASGQVAAMLGVKPVADAGLPTALALAAPARDGVALALAEPVPAAPPPAAPATPQVAAVSLPLEAPEAAPATPAVPAMLAATAPVLLRAPSIPARVAFTPAARPVARGAYVVQLGAYARSGAIEAAWLQASRMSPQVATLSPVRGHYSLSGAMLVRLSVGGFVNRIDAVKLCDKVKARGGQCFVRATFNDAPVQWAKSDTAVRLASNS